MSEQLDAYMEYLRQLNILSRLDMILVRQDGGVVAEFAHYTRHKLIQNRRKNAKKKFLDQMCLQSRSVPRYAGSETPAAVDGYNFFGFPVTVSGSRLFLCLGPFYIDGLITDMIEEDLPHYGINDIPGVVTLFRRLPEVSAEGVAGDTGTGKEGCVRDTQGKELEAMELIRLNSPTQIKYNARIEKAMRTAIMNGDEERMERLNKEFYFMEAGHYLADVNSLKRMKHIAMIGNTVGCRAAEDGGAPSVLVRSICADFADKIEALDDIPGLNGLMRELSTVYCKKVRETKLEGYSLHVRQCIKWMYAHLDREPTLKEAAENSRVSYEYMSRLINKECGCNFSELLHRIRCEAATGYLQCGEGIRETAEKCGYKNSSQFCRAFQKIYGMSPGKWRQEHML